MLDVQFLLFVELLVHRNCPKLRYLWNVGNFPCDFEIIPNERQARGLRDSDNDLVYRF